MMTDRQSSLISKAAKVVQPDSLWWGIETVYKWKAVHDVVYVAIIGNKEYQAPNLLVFRFE